MIQQTCVDVISLERIVREIKSRIKFPGKTTCRYYPSKKELVFNLPEGYFVSVIPPGIDHWFYVGDGKLHFDLESDKVTIVKRKDFGDKLLEIFDVSNGKPLKSNYNGYKITINPNYHLKK